MSKDSYEKIRQEVSGKYKARIEQLEREKELLQEEYNVLYKEYLKLKAKEDESQSPIGKVLVSGMGTHFAKEIVRQTFDVQDYIIALDEHRLNSR